MCLPGRAQSLWCRMTALLDSSGTLVVPACGPDVQGVFCGATCMGAAGADAPGALRLRGRLGAGHGLQPRSNGVSALLTAGQSCCSCTMAGAARTLAPAWCLARLCEPAPASRAGGTTSLTSWRACCLARSPWASSRGWGALDGAAATRWHAHDSHDVFAGISQMGPMCWLPFHPTHSGAGAMCRPSCCRAPLPPWAWRCPSSRARRRTPRWCAHGVPWLQQHACDFHCPAAVCSVAYFDRLDSNCGSGAADTAGRHL